MKKNFLLALFLMILACSSLKAQRLPSLDSVKTLLTNMTLQIEITSGVDDLYNFKFARAESQFHWIRRAYPEHPLPYFLLGLSNWWKIAPNVNKYAYDDVFFAYMDSSIMYAEEMFDEDETNLEAPFFLAAAYAFKARLYSERSNWTKATFAGKNALKYLEYSKAHSELSPELLFGDALYNYFSVWIPENYPILKPILMFFDKGDKELGIEQLETVVKEAFYAKVEAQYFLMRIYSFEKSHMRKALGLAEYLHMKYPDNPYFHRYYARSLYSVGNFEKLAKVSQDILNKIDSGMVGYEEISGRYAGFYLGDYYRRVEHNDKLSRNYYLRAVNFSEQLKAFDSGYYLYSLSNLGKIAIELEEMDEAKIYYDKILEHAERKHPAYKSAKEFKKEYKRYQKDKSS
ncbi:tol-pal system protein YbgF [Flammeovirgaceae bacterium SG7u.111]|nr:tol-pal system protein YbgF [Flammeovirgaceae bacterium SG7u.132]WPO34432.1 tol-pal system protein YbgF [Flammeovirgaceae bacterium SG7u.111]